MLVWHDTEKRTQARPSWLPPAPAISRAHTQLGDVLCVGTRNAPMLEYRPGEDWQDAGEGWSFALYGNDPDLPAMVRRDQPWTMVGTILDGRGREWVIPCMLFPSADRITPGPPIVAQARRMTPSGWVREPLHELQRAALDACQAAWPHLSDLGGMDLEAQGSAITAILEASLHVSGLGLARLGLIDDILVEKGLKLACGWLDPREK